MWREHRNRPRRSAVPATSTRCSRRTADVSLPHCASYRICRARTRTAVGRFPRLRYTMRLFVSPLRHGGGAHVELAFPFRSCRRLPSGAAALRHGRGARASAGRVARRALHGRRAGLSDGAGRRRRLLSSRATSCTHNTPGRAGRCSWSSSSPGWPSAGSPSIGPAARSIRPTPGRGRRAAGERTPLPARPGG